METITEEELLLARHGFARRASQKYENVRALVCLPLEQDGFTNAFSTRTGGVSSMPKDDLNLAGFNDDTRENIYENRRRFLKLFDDNQTAWTLASCWQIHGTNVRVVRDESDASKSDDEKCDALITKKNDLLLAVKTADCVPVLLGDARTGACAAIHAGWRGTIGRIAQKAIAGMQKEFGTRTEDVRASIGAAARACCYEVGGEVIDAFRQEFTYADTLLTPTRTTVSENGERHALIDLQRANELQLIESSVQPSRIHILPLCTMCRTDIFFSYRREKNLHGRTGRLFSVIGRKAKVTG
ncbi:MAG: peptidoglycan editing factor PgeF [Pyrinomonadaceae bacterium]